MHGISKWKSWYIKMESVKFCKRSLENEIIYSQIEYYFSTAQKSIEVKIEKKLHPCFANLRFSNFETLSLN